MTLRDITAALALALATTTLSAQSAESQPADDTTQETDSLPINACRKGHYVLLNLGGGLHNTAFSVSDNGTKKAGFGFGVSAGYRYFFKENWGVGVGLGFNTFSGTAKLNYLQSERNGSDAAILAEHKERNFQTTFHEVEEKVSVSALDIPVGLYFQQSLGKRWRLGVGANLMVSAVMGSKSKINSGTIKVDAEYPYYNLSMSDVPSHKLTTYDNFGCTPDLKKISLGAGGEIGAYYAVNKKLDIFMGVNAAYRFSDIKNKNLDKLFDEEQAKYAGVTQTAYCSSVNLVNVSATIGIRYRIERKPKPKPVYTPEPEPEPQPEPEPLPAPIQSETAIDLKPAVADIMPTDYVYVNTSDDMSKQLKRKKVGDPIGTPILFATNSDKLRGDNSFSILDTVTVFLRENPDVTRMQISAHTDDVGTDAYNLDLSKRRAKTVVDYIIGKGIDPKRLVTVGYGESRPLNNNATPEQREVNRRVEFMILEVEDKE